MLNEKEKKEEKTYNLKGRSKKVNMSQPRSRYKISNTVVIPG
jgi:hypothetical protein